jgi:catechol 2,3-dioxygenase-like lactoylglutathione lyase family enzyme
VANVQTKSKPAKAPAKLKTSALVPKMLNHAAYVTHDVAATVEFYTKVMGMELASTVFDDRIPSTGDAFPYFHVFFRMGDGSTIAFFEAPGLPAAEPPSHPAYAIFNHIALQVDTADEVKRWYAWLKQHGLELVGPTNHADEFLSIYFHDPNGVRLEITTPLDPHWNQHTDRARRDLALWLEAKEQARRDGRDIPAALIELIRRERARYQPN